MNIHRCGNGLCYNYPVKRWIMDMNWGDMDVDALREIYDKESAKLKTSLLSGSSWDDMKDQ